MMDKMMSCYMLGEPSSEKIGIFGNQPDPRPPKNIKVWIFLDWIYGYLLTALAKMQGRGEFQKVGSITPLQAAATS